MEILQDVKLDKTKECIIQYWFDGAEYYKIVLSKKDYSKMQWQRMAKGLEVAQN